MRFTALYNMPGYLPEMEPVTFDNLADACDFLMDECDRMASDCDDYHAAKEWSEINVDLAKLKHGTLPESNNPDFFGDVAYLGPDGYYYCISTE